MESTRASLLQAGFPDIWWAVCMIYFVAMWNGHMRGRDGLAPYQRKHGEDAPVFAHLHKPVVEDEEESDRWRSKLTPCILVEVTMGPAGVWALLRRCASLQVHWLKSAVGCARETQHRHRLF